MSGEESERPAPDDVFETLGDETRLAILRALAESWNEAGFTLDYALTFSELRAAVGVDDSGRFNYHLQRMTDHLVRETGDGYEFRYLGWKIARLVLKEGVHEPVETTSVTFESRCHECGHGTLVGRYVNEWLWIRCPDCGEPVTDVGLRPSVLETHSPPEVAAICDRRARRRVELFLDGVCADCLRDVERTVGTHRWGPDELTRPIYRCPGCETEMLPALGWYAIDDPAVVDFYARRGVDVTAVPHWELGPLVSDAYTTVAGRNPWLFVVEFPCREETLPVAVDGSGSVRAVGDPV